MEMRKFTIHDLEIDAAASSVSVSGERVRLTETEYRILLKLIENSDRALTRREIISAVLGDDSPTNERAVDVHIAGLRKKLGSSRGCIETVRGSGFQFRAAPD